MSGSNNYQRITGGIQAGTTKFAASAQISHSVDSEPLDPYSEQVLPSH